MNQHSTVLKQCLPAVSYDANASNLAIELSAVGNQLDSALHYADQLAEEMVADTAMQTLTDWERVYGLPDACVTIAQSLAQRKAALLSKVQAKGGQSRAYFISLAMALGYPAASIDEFALLTCNSDCNGELNSQNDLLAWRLNLPNASGGLFVMDCDSDCNSALQSWGDEAIQCRIDLFKPAHTSVIFAYP